MPPWEEIPGSDFQQRLFICKNEFEITHDFGQDIYYDRGRRRRLFPEGWEKKKNHDVRLDLIKKIPIKNGEGGRTPKNETLYRSRAPAGRGEERRKESGTAEGSKSKAVIYHPRTQSKRRSAVQLNCVVKSVKIVVFVELWGRSGFLHFVEDVLQLDTLREDCGIIRKQASTDGGVLWKIMCVDVVQVWRKDGSLRDPREARSRVRI
ncbi:hypothetical protein TNCV_787571 [Trichonephila clavipes]|nr:hypothetical protein TNCV_787571 [Trichonephila clavipes]